MSRVLRRPGFFASLAIVVVTSFLAGKINRWHHESTQENRAEWVSACEKLVNDSTRIWPTDKKEQHAIHECVNKLEKRQTASAGAALKKVRAPADGLSGDEQGSEGRLCFTVPPQGWLLGNRVCLPVPRADDTSQTSGKRFRPAEKDRFWIITSVLFSLLRGMIAGWYISSYCRSRPPPQSDYRPDPPPPADDEELGGPSDSPNGSSNSSPVCYDDRHKRFIDNLWQEGLIVHEMDSDGNCFFRSLSYQILHNADHHADIRNAIVVSMRNRLHQWGPFLASGEEPEDRLAYVSQNRAWGGEIEAREAAVALMVRIRVWTPDNTTGGLHFTTYEPEVLRNDAQLIHLAHFVNHYQSLELVAK